MEDRVNTNVPEYLKFQQNDRVIFEWGVGGDDKMNSSSWILNEFLKDERHNLFGDCRETLKHLMKSKNLYYIPTIL